MFKDKKILILLSIILFASAFSIINNVFLVYGQITNPQWRGTSSIKAPYLAENLEWLYQNINGSSGTQGISPVDAGVLVGTTYTTFGPDIKLIDLKGGSYYGDAAPHAAYVLRISNTQVKFVMFNWNAYYRRVFTVNLNQEVCYGLCVKLDGSSNILLRTEGGFNGNFIYLSFR